MAAELKPLYLAGAFLLLTAGEHEFVELHPFQLRSICHSLFPLANILLLLCLPSKRELLSTVAFMDPLLSSFPNPFRSASLINLISKALESLICFSPGDAWPFPSINIPSQLKDQPTIRTLRAHFVAMKTVAALNLAEGRKRVFNLAYRTDPTAIP